MHMRLIRNNLCDFYLLGRVDDSARDEKHDKENFSIRRGVSVSKANNTKSTATRPLKEAALLRCFHTHTRVLLHSATKTDLPSKFNP
eukprot:2461690-Amphidinium_carterae.1